MVKVEVLGAVGRIDDTEALLRSVRKIGKGEALPLDADLICGKDHLRSAAFHATRAFERGDNVTSTISVEALLYASGERQISRAMKKVGVKRGSERIAFIFFDVEDPKEVLRSLMLTRDDDVLEPSAEKAIRFGVSPEELKAVPSDMIEDLILERVAFVGMQK